MGKVKHLLGKYHSVSLPMSLLASEKLPDEWKGEGVYLRKEVSMFHIDQFVYECHKGLLPKGNMVQTTKSTACLICLSAVHAKSANWINTNHKLKGFINFLPYKKGM